MSRAHEYETPDGRTADKRLWTIGTPVTVKFRDGRLMETTVASVPWQFGSGTWSCRLRGVPYVMPLDRLTRRYQGDLLPADPEGSRESESETDRA